MFTNKHVIIALLVAPVLAIVAWFGIGAMVGEKPHLATPGQSYPLVEQSNCRYDSGQCDLRNEDLRLSITMDSNSATPTLILTSSHALDNALLGIDTGGEATQPGSLRPLDNEGLRWALSMTELPTREQRLLVAVTATGSHWFAETSTVFLDPYRE